MTIDLTPILQTIAGIATIALGTIGSWALAALAKKLGVQQNSIAMANLDGVLMKGISAAVMLSQDEIKAKGWAHPAIQNKLVAEGTQYVTDKFADTLAQSGIDPATPGGQAAIKAAIYRALPQGVLEAAQSPTTPPITPPS